MSCDDGLKAHVARHGIPVTSPVKLGRNDPCPCGSGKKAKRCCLNKITALAALPSRLRERLVAAQILGHDPYLVVPPAGPTTVQDTASTPAAEQGQGNPGSQDLSCNGVEGV
jgi:hypothetical protein